jgi:hypothetical protein
MSSRILGVTPAAPGYTRIAIRPHISGLRFAKGVVPTPMGDVSVGWASSDADFRLDVSLPENASADVLLPVTEIANPTLTVDGKPSASPYQAGAAFTVTAGTHEFVLKAR